MSRESAIEFLKEVSNGINYLESVYSNNHQTNQISDPSKVG